MAEKQKIYLIASNEAYAQSAQQVLSKDYDVSIFEDAEKARIAALANKPDAFMMAYADGAKASGTNLSLLIHPGETLGVLENIPVLVMNPPDVLLKSADDGIYTHKFPKREQALDVAFIGKSNPETPFTPQDWPAKIQQALLRLKGSTPAPDGDNRPIALVAEDEEAVASLLEMYLGDAGYKVIMKDNAAEIRDAMNVVKPALLISDRGLTDGDTGVELVKEFKKKFPNIPAMMVTGSPEKAKAELGGVGANMPILGKPLDSAKFIESIEKCKPSHAKQVGGPHKLGERPIAKSPLLNH